MQDTNQPNTFNWSDPTAFEKRKARVAFWRARQSARYLPTITKTAKWLVPDLADRATCLGTLNLAICAVGAFDFGWTIGATINKTFLGRWNGGYSCMTPFGCSQSSGKPTTPTGDTDFVSIGWSSQQSSYGNLSPWSSVDSDPYPCGLTSPAQYWTGCDPAPSGGPSTYVTAKFEFATTQWNQFGVTASIGVLDTDRCKSFAVNGALAGAPSFVYDSAVKQWICTFKTQVAVNDAYYAWNWMKVAGGINNDTTVADTPAPCHIWEHRPGSSSDAPPTFDCYMTPTEWEERVLDINPGTGTGQNNVAAGAYTPPSPTTGDRNAAKGILTDGHHKSGRRAINCAINPASSWCTGNPGGDTDTPTGSPQTTVTQNVYVTNFPSTVNVTGTVGVTGTVTTFVPFVLPKPDLSEAYGDYIDRLRASGWVGTATIDAVEPGSGISTYGPDAITRIHVTAVGADQDPNAWPVNAPLVTSPSVEIHIRVNPHAAPNLGANCGPSIPSVNFAPITSIAFGSKFPFGIFSFIGTALSPLVASPTAPVFDVPITVNGTTYSLHVDFSPADPYMATIRLLMEIGISLTAVWLLATSLLGFRAGNSGGGLEMTPEMDD